MDDNRNTERQREREMRKRGRRRRDFGVDAVAEVLKKVCNLRGVIGTWGGGVDRCRRAYFGSFHVHTWYILWTRVVA